MKYVHFLTKTLRPFILIKAQIYCLEFFNRKVKFGGFGFVKKKLVNKTGT